ncbi:hypothetical protein [Jannaschia sp. R86511]|uniref:hypothetical protein n=1 Tax=Jannaschia sp. R86511 TaxID=3093853 RepID=UPI0036D2970B
MSALRSLAALLAVVAVLVGLVAAAEWFARGQVEAVVGDVVSRELGQVADPGEELQDVTASVRGSVLLGLARGRFEGLDVTTGAGQVQGVPVRALEVRADGVATDGSTAGSLTATVRAEAGAALSTQLQGEDQAELAQAVLTGTTALPPDRLQVQAPFEVPVLGSVPVEVVLQLRVEEGRLLVEPVEARAAGLDLDLDRTDTLRAFGVDDELPDGVDVSAVSVVDEGGTAVVVAELVCDDGCPFGR